MNQDDRAQSSDTGPYFCGVCQKPFTKNSSRNRHTTYCRRKKGLPRMRQKSCQACNLAKAKCSFEPICSRCTIKGLDCVYENSRIDASYVSSKQSTPASNDDNGMLFHDDEALLSDWLVPSEPEVTAVGNGMPWDPSALSLIGDLANPNMHAFADTITEGNAEPTTILNNALPSFEVAEQAISSKNLTNTSNLAAPFDLSLDVAQHMLTRLVEPRTNAKITAKFVFDGLRAFPRMMLHKETFPPFIHPCFSHTFHHGAGGLLDSIQNCIAISQLFVNRTTETSQFLWQTMRTEQVRLLKAKEKMSQHESLAAVQALIIYVIMRVVANDPRHADYDVHTLYTFQYLCERLQILDGSILIHSVRRDYSNMTWEDWLFSESRRRLCIVWFLIDRIVFARTGIVCEVVDNFRELPLPTSKTLWDAHDRASWRVACQRENKIAQTGLDTVGDLIDLYQDPDDPLNAERLDIWNSRIDNLGHLLNLAVVTR